MPPALVVDPSPARAIVPWHRMDGPLTRTSRIPDDGSTRWRPRRARARSWSSAPDPSPGASQLWVSPDGATWTESDLPARFEGRLTDLVSTADGFLTIGAGTTLGSSDGRAWTERSSLAGVDLHVVAAAGDRLVAGGRVGTDGRPRAAIWTSSDAGSTWERTSFAEGRAIEEIAVSRDGTVLALILDAGLGDPDLHTKLWSFNDSRSHAIDLPGRVGFVTGVSWNEHGFSVTRRPAPRAARRAARDRVALRGRPDLDPGHVDTRFRDRRPRSGRLHPVVRIGWDRRPAGGSGLGRAVGRRRDLEGSTGSGTDRPSAMPSPSMAGSWPPARSTSSRRPMAPSGWQSFPGDPCRRTDDRNTEPDPPPRFYRTLGPAAMISAETLSSKRLKFSMNIAGELVRLRVVGGKIAHVLRGWSTSSGTPGTCTGTCTRTSGRPRSRRR